MAIRAALGCAFAVAVSAGCGAMPNVGNCPLSVAQFRTAPVDTIVLTPPYAVMAETGQGRGNGGAFLTLSGERWKRPTARAIAPSGQVAFELPVSAVNGAQTANLFLPNRGMWRVSLTDRQTGCATEVAILVS